MPLEFGSFPIRPLCDNHLAMPQKTFSDKFVNSSASYSHITVNKLNNIDCQRKTKTKINLIRVLLIGDVNRAEEGKD